MVLVGQESNPTAAGRLLFIAAPTTRCGTTLLQRLFCSSPDALIFGEGVGSVLLEMVRGLESRTRLLPRAEALRRDLERVLAGQQFWCPHLAPDVRAYVQLFVESLARFLAFHAQEAERHGRRVWGAKLPTVPVANLRLLRTFVPGSRVLYVVRDLVAAIRSAKARGFLKTHQDLRNYAIRWRQGVIDIEGLRNDPAVRVIDYERLEQRDPALLEELEAFAGVRALDPEVLKVRINTWDRAEPGCARGGYVRPASLSEEELELVERELRFAVTGTVSLDKSELSPTPPVG